MPNYGLEITDAAGQIWGVNDWIARVIFSETIYSQKSYYLSNYSNDTSKVFISVSLLYDIDNYGYEHGAAPIIRKNYQNENEVIVMGSSRGVKVFIGVLNV